MPADSKTPTVWQRESWLWRVLAVLGLVLALFIVLGVSIVEVHFVVFNMRAPLTDEHWFRVLRNAEIAFVIGTAIVVPWWLCLISSGFGARLWATITALVWLIPVLPMYAGMCVSQVFEVKYGSMTSKALELIHFIAWPVAMAQIWVGWRAWSLVRQMRGDTVERVWNRGAR